MKRCRPAPNLRDLLTVKEAAEFLGICVKTLHNWDRASKLKPLRNPLNGYRLYRRRDLEHLLAQIARGGW